MWKYNYIDIIFCDLISLVSQICDGQNDSIYCLVKKYIKLDTKESELKVSLLLGEKYM